MREQKQEGIGKVFLLIGILLILTVIAAVATSVFMKGKASNDKELLIESTPDSLPVSADGASGEVLTDNEQISAPESSESNTTIDFGNDFEEENEYPEIDWEEPPVVTYYNEDADTDNSGYVDKAEWEVWCANHPEDLDQNMVIDEEEQAAYESKNQSEMAEYQPSTMPEKEDHDIIDEPSQEEIDANIAEGEAWAAERGQGTSRLDNYNSGNTFEEGAAEGVYGDPNLRVNMS